MQVRRRVCKAPCDLGSEGFVAVADDGGDTWDVGEFFRSALSVAAGGDDAGFGVEAVGAANVGAGFAVGLGGDAAGVDDDHIGFVRLAVFHSGVAEESSDGFAVGAGGATAEVFDVEGGRHGSSLADVAALGGSGFSGRFTAVSGALRR